MSKPEHVSDKDRADMTKFYRTIYELHQKSLANARNTLQQGQALLKNKVTWDDSQGKTLIDASEARIRQINQMITDLLVKCAQYLGEKKIDKFW